MRSTRADIIGAVPVYLLEITWAGKIYNISTYPINLLSDNGEVYFDGGLLDDPEISFQLPDVGFTIESYSIPVACILKGVNVSNEVLQNNTLQRANAELSYVMVSSEKALTYEKRIQIIKGVIKQPVFGHKDKPEGYVEFSIETSTINSSLYGLITGSGSRLNPLEISDTINAALSPFTTIYKTSTEVIDVSEIHKGKQLPIVIGEAGNIYNEFNELEYYSASPAYVLHVSSAAHNTIYLVIAAHAVEASTVRIFDNKGNFALQNVAKWIRSNGEVFSYVTFNLNTSGLGDIRTDNSVQYYTSWSSGGGLVSPSRNTAIMGGGELCLYCLNQGNQNIDFSSWDAVKDVLNQYKFGGYINNTEVNPLEFLQNEIIPFLPISIINGNEGLRPIVDLYLLHDPFIIAEIAANKDFVAISAVITFTDESDIINDYSLKYAYDIRITDHRAIMRCTGDDSLINKTTFTSRYAKESYLKYGNRPKIEESNFIHDSNTAALVCMNKIKLNSRSVRVVDYAISSKYAYLDIGDLISFTDNENCIYNKTVQVINKKYNSFQWIISLKILG